LERAHAHEDHRAAKEASTMAVAFHEVRNRLSMENGGKLGGFLFADPPPSDFVKMMLKGSINACVECGGYMKPVATDLDENMVGMICNLGDRLAVGFHSECASILDIPSKRADLFGRISRGEAGGAINAEGGAVDPQVIANYLADFEATLSPQGQ
jgi:hypothetical protein